MYLVAFAAGLVNATAKMNFEARRIYIIVITAVHHLDVTGLKWKKIWEDISIQSI